MIVKDIWGQYNVVLDQTTEILGEFYLLLYPHMNPYKRPEDERWVKNWFHENKIKEIYDGISSDRKQGST